MKLDIMIRKLSEERAKLDEIIASLQQLRSQRSVLAHGITKRRCRKAVDTGKR